MERYRMLESATKNKSHAIRIMLVTYLFYIAGVITGLVTMSINILWD